MGDLDDFIPGLFHVAEDVIGKSVEELEVISNAERIGDRSLHSQIARNS